MRPQDFYDQSEIWDEQLTEGQRSVSHALAAFWPENVSTCVDVGCGDGKVAAILRQNTGSNIVGVDFSEVALAKANLPVALADIGSLPFRDNSMDLTLCMDVIEHLTEKLQREAVSELFRIAKDYVILVVPFAENLPDATTKCQSCHSLYHLNWHQRAYDAMGLLELKPRDWNAAGFILAGERWNTTPPLVTDWTRAGKNTWSGWPSGICPTCGAPNRIVSSDPSFQDEEISHLNDKLLEDAVKYGLKSRAHTEIVGLFSRSADLSKSWRACVRERLLSKYSRVRADIRPANQTILPFELSILDSLLFQFPIVARSTRGSDGTVIVQSPVLGDVCEIVLNFPESYTGAVKFTVEDRGGLVEAFDLIVSENKNFTIRLHRLLQGGLYGALVRISDDIPGLSIRIGSETPLFIHQYDVDTITYFEPDSERNLPMWSQLSRPTWLGVDQLELAFRHETLSVVELQRFVDLLPSSDRGARLTDFFRLRDESFH